MFSDGICLVSNLILDVILVPRYGFVGASFGTLFALIIQSVVTYFFLSRHFRRIYWKESVFVPVLSAFILVLFLFGSGSRDSLILLPFGIAIYIGMLIIFKGFSLEDINYIKRMMGLKKIRSDNI